MACRSSLGDYENIFALDELQLNIVCLFVIIFDISQLRTSPSVLLLFWFCLPYYYNRLNERALYSLIRIYIWVLDVVVGILLN